MKKLFLSTVLSLFALVVFGQTTMTDADIQAQASNRYEYLMTNIVDDYAYSKSQWLLNDMDLTPSETGFENNDSRMTFRFEKQILTGDEKQQYVDGLWEYEKIKGQKVVKKVTISGPSRLVTEFYVKFWSRKLNFDDVKPGETVSTRFLTDVATLTFNYDGTAKIEVVPAKDRFRD